MLSIKIYIYIRRTIFIYFCKLQIEFQLWLMNQSTVCSPSFLLIPRASVNASSQKVVWTRRDFIFRIFSFFSLSSSLILFLFGSRIANSQLAIQLSYVRLRQVVAALATILRVGCLSLASLVLFAFLSCVAKTQLFKL